MPERPYAYDGTQKQTQEGAQCGLFVVFEEPADQVAGYDNPQYYAYSHRNHHVEGIHGNCKIRRDPGRRVSQEANLDLIHRTEDHGILTEEQHQIPAADSGKYHGGSSGQACNGQDDVAGAADPGGFPQDAGQQHHQQESTAGPCNHRRAGGASHPPNQGYSPQGETNEQAVHHPTVFDHQAPHRTGQEQNGHDRRPDHRRQHQESAPPEPQPRDVRHRLDEIGINAGREEHRSAADSGHQIREPHQQAAHGHPDRQRDTLRPVERAPAPAPAPTHHLVLRSVLPSFRSSASKPW